MGEPKDQAEQALLDALNAVIVIDLAVTRAIDAMDANNVDDQRAFELATDLQQRLRKRHDELQGLRAALVERIKTREALSLAHLANRLSMSRARADQLLQLAKKAEQPDEKEER